MNRNHGFSLLEIVIGLAILGIVSLGLANMLAQYTRWSARNDAADFASEQIRVTGVQLQKFLEGTRTMQGLSFRVPGTALSCAGVGFCIEPDKDINGAKSPGNDLLYVVSQIPLGTEMRLTADYLAGAKISARTLDAVTPLTKLLGRGDYVVVTNVQASEMARLVDDPTNAPTGLFPIDFVPTFGGSIVGTYLAGDAVAKTRITAVGFDPATNEIKLRDIPSGEVRILAQKMVQFAVTYELTNATLVAASCPLTALNDFKHDWVSVNARQCYKGISRIQTTYSAKSPLGRKIGTYVFKTAI